MPPKLSIEVKRYDPPRRTLAAVEEEIVRVARAHVGEVDHRLLSFRLLPPEKTKRARPARPSDFLATVYDYESSRTLDLRGSLKDPKRIEIVESARQPGVTHQEWEAAVEVVLRDDELGPLVEDGRLTPYKPMPPHVPVERPDGSRERRVTVGLQPAGRRVKHEIVAVDLARRRITRFDKGAPDNSRAAPAMCGVPQNSSQATADQGTAGQVIVKVSRGNTVLWEFVAVRPAASSGFWGSGVELRNVAYRGRSVLHQAHVPILNVRYDKDACGPFRDWQWQEGMIQAAGQTVAPGFRLCTGKARTILQSGSDTGNFLGVGIYLDGEEVVLVSELEAGWYRYVSEWRLHANGQIQPRFGFAATRDTCVCNIHHHHTYWRFDFDVGDTVNVVKEFNDPPPAGAKKWTTMKFEAKRMRNAARKRRWRVENLAGRGYEIVPGPHDGTAVGDPYAKGDFWAIRYRPNEIDDHPISDTEIEIDRFVTRQPLAHQDVVVWYGAHFTHDVHEHGAAEPDHVVGPTLVPYKWG
jgi:hypothetical protein